MVPARHEPYGDKALSPTKDTLPSLQDRIHNLGTTLAAGLPASKRHHAVARLDPADQGRLARVMTGVVQALPLGPRIVPLRVLGTNADARGIVSFVNAGAVMQAADSHADVREATDLVGRSAQEMGLDRFRPFLREADDHLARTGGMVALLKDVPVSPAPFMVRPPVGAPAGPGLPPPGLLGPLLRTILRGALVGNLAELFKDYTSYDKEQQLRDVIERFRLDPTNPADAAAALAFRWAQNIGPWVFDTPQIGPGMQAMAERVLRAVQADPALLGRALNGDRPSITALTSMAQGKTIPGSGIETRSDEERALVSQMLSEGRSGDEIQAALDHLRMNKGGATATLDSADKQPPVQQISPEKIRFSQRTAGGNGRANGQREYVKKNGTISSPVDAVRTADGIVTIDNTRVAVAREHGLATIPVRVWEPSDPLPADMRRRFGVARTWGDALQFRTGSQRPGLPPTGTNN